MFIYGQSSLSEVAVDGGGVDRAALSDVGKVVLVKYYQLRGCHGFGVGVNILR